MHYFSRIIAISALSIAITSCNDAPKQSPETTTATETKKPDYNKLTADLDSIAKTVDAKIALGYINIETGDTFSYNGRSHVPMQSTIKFPLAVMIMQQVDSGKLSLEQVIPITKYERNTPTNSTFLRDLQGAPGMSVHRMLEYMTHISDNITFDAFTRLAGGGKRIESFVKAQGMNGIGVAERKGQFYVDFGIPSDTWCEPIDMAALLVKFYKGELLSKTATDTLRNIMERTTGGTGRIKGLLPAGTVVAHKTGTSGMENGRTAAVNDIGIVTLPDGNHLVLTVYVTEVAGDMAAGEAIIAKVAKAAYDAAVK
jgi:beta-lactamase class A